MRRQAGFSLLEVLLVIAIISATLYAFLAASTREQAARTAAQDYWASVEHKSPEGEKKIIEHLRTECLKNMPGSQDPEQYLKTQQECGEDLIVSLLARRQASRLDDGQAERLIGRLRDPGE